MLYSSKTFGRILHQVLLYAVDGIIVEEDERPCFGAEGEHPCFGAEGERPCFVAEGEHPCFEAEGERPCFGEQRVNVPALESRQKAVSMIAFPALEQYIR